MSNDNNLCYIIPDDVKNDTAACVAFLSDHPAVRFVSLVGVDFLGNDTDERIPLPYFLDNIGTIFSGGVQTDGSSVNMPGVATLDDAKIDFIIDFNSIWRVDYNSDHIVDGLPAGTLRIPIFFKHHEAEYCSRSVLRNTLNHLAEKLTSRVKHDAGFLSAHNINAGDVDTVYFTLGTELEFWVRSAVGDVSAEQLELSQSLKESYWKRTKGQVRTCLEKTLLILERHGYTPEMAHKEVGGVKGKLSEDGQFYSVMEQLEIDWKFSDPLTAADNELYARILIKEIFRKHGLDVTFTAKPVDGVAGSGEHMHLGIGIALQNGRRINLFAPENADAYLSRYGYGALMGLLKNWQYISPFVTNSISALKRLQPGFEAPVSPVASLGRSVHKPSRNRTVLAGLVRSDNPLSTRFEVRAPNPHTNTYLSTSAMLIGMVHGITETAGRDTADLHGELMKSPGEDATYLEQKRQYISEKNIFEDYSEQERAERFGSSPRTVWEMFSSLNTCPDLFTDTPLTPEIIASYRTGSLQRWCIELRKKIIPAMKAVMKSFSRLAEHENKYDVLRWNKVEHARLAIAKDDRNRKSLMTDLVENITANNFENVSTLSIELFEQYRLCCERYEEYRVNFLF